MYTVQPGQEVYPNYCATVPNTKEFDVGKIQSWMTSGSSHDLMVYRAPPVAGPSPGACTIAGANSMIFMASISDQIVELKMPDGVGYALQTGTQIIVSMHFLNSGTTPMKPQVKLNFFRAASYQYEAGVMLGFDTGIDVPAATPSGPGTQTVAGSCTATAGSQFFALGTHTNGHATTADVNFVSGTTTNVVHTTNWQLPDVGIWPVSPFLTLENGDSLNYRCSYSNNGASSVVVGEDQSNDLCMLVGYYFPAGSAACQSP
jgi:hypothetical protein